MSEVVFLIDRNIYYKYLAPVIDEALKYHLKITLLHLSHGTNLKKGDDKLFYYPQLSQIPQFHKKIQHSAMLNDIDELKEYLKRNKTKLVFSLHPRNRYGIEASDLKWVTVQHGIDSTKYPHQETDYYITYTKHWLEGNSISEGCKIFEAGLFYANQEFVGIRESVCGKYNLDPDKKYFLFIPLPSDSPQNYIFFPNKLYAYYHLKRLEKIELNILDHLKKSLKNSDTELIIKSRFKRLLPAKYREYGHIIYDETFHPNTISELCSISSHCFINFMPTATTIELAAFNLPFTFIHYPEYDKYVFSHIKNKMKDIFLPEKPTSWVLHTNLDRLSDATNDQQGFDQKYITQYIKNSNYLKLNLILETIVKETFSNA